MLSPPPGDQNRKVSNVDGSVTVEVSDLIVGIPSTHEDTKISDIDLTIEVHIANLTDIDGDTTVTCLTVSATSEGVGFTGC